jgi:hypothetical protein
MEMNSGQSTPPANSITITLPQFLVRWYKNLPTSTWRAALLLFAFGVGIGGGTLALKETLQWYRHRPLPPLSDRQWSEFIFPEYGLKAELSTKWIEPLDELDYKLSLMPSDITNSEEFFNRITVAQHSLAMNGVTLNVYDKRHFVVKSNDNYLLLFTSIVDPDGKTSLAVHQGKLFLSRDEYAALTDWDLTVQGLAPIKRNSATVNTPPKQNSSEKPSDTSGLHARTQKQGGLGGESQANGLQGDDIITGYSVVESNLATSGGLTFHIYKDAEVDKAIEWGVDSARVHYECGTTLECTLHRAGTGVILPAKLRK